jgi:hypothetical protein
MINGSGQLGQHVGFQATTAASIRSAFGYAPIALDGPQEPTDGRW